MNRDLAEIRKLHRHKSGGLAPVPQAFGPDLINFFKQSIDKRQSKLTKIAEAWTSLMPPLLSDHCALESFSRGTLTVMVDTSAHLYEIKQVLLAGLEKQLLFACRAAGLRKITLRPGRWYTDSRNPAFPQ